VGVGTAALTFTTATSGNRTYVAAGAEEGDQFWARIQHQTIPTEWEICLATVVGGTIVRSAPTSSSTGAAVAFSTGNKIVSDGVLFAGIPRADGEEIAEPDVAADDVLQVFDVSAQKWKPLLFGAIGGLYEAAGEAQAAAAAAVAAVSAFVGAAGLINTTP